MTNSIYATKQYFKNIIDGKYGTKITITDTMKEHINTVISQWNFWHNRAQELINEKILLQEELINAQNELIKIEKFQQLVQLLKEVTNG